MMPMSENATPQAPAERRRPVTLIRRPSAGMTEMLRRVVPDAVEDSGLSRLDVAAFQSSI